MEEEYEPKPEKEKKIVYKFRYDSKPKKDIPINYPFDTEAVDFDREGLDLGCSKSKADYENIEEHTLLLIKPSAMGYKDLIRKRVYEEGFSCLKERTVWLESEEMSEFYKGHYGKPWFPKFIMKMTAGPIHVMILAKINAIKDLKSLMGNKRVSIARKESPNSLRAMYGLKGDSSTNGVHGSEDQEQAHTEIRFFFTDAIPEPVPDVLTYMDYIHEKDMVNVFVEALDEIKKEKPENTLNWLSEWLQQQNKKPPNIEPEYLMKLPI